MIFIFFFTIRIVLSFTAADNIFFLVFGLIQQPLQGVAATPVAIMLLLTLTNLVWFFGIHPNMVYAILTPLMAGILPEIIKAFQEGTMPLPYLTITILVLRQGMHLVDKSELTDGSFLLLVPNQKHINHFGNLQ